MSGIVTTGPEYRENCMGHGKDIAGRCRCDPLYYGHRCQYKDECADDKGCGRHGKCINVDATSAPRKQCFCEMGWYGPDCTKRKSGTSLAAHRPTLRHAGPVIYGWYVAVRGT
jgi:hypothetical protein